MKEKDLNLLLRKADELRALFLLGQKVIPFLEEIFVFVKDIQPLLDEINTSITDNLKKMPGASEQLSKVTEANELATNEIMDILDGMFFKVDIVSKNQEKIKDIYIKNINNPIKLLDIIKKGIIADKDLKPIVPNINLALEKFKEVSETELDVLLNENKGIMGTINNDANSIMMSLQVQDITSQQIASVNHLLQTVQGKLITILNHFNESDLEKMIHSDSAHEDNINISVLHREIAFDPHAVDSIMKKETRQAEIDELIASHENEQYSNNDIDAIFDNANSDTNHNDSIDSNSENMDELASVDDIDAMFNNNTTNIQEEKYEDENSQFSQDDIDSMFSK